MTFRLGLAQCPYPADGDVENLVSSLAFRAAEDGVGLLVFPECLTTPLGCKPGDLAAAAQPIGGPFSLSVARIAKQCGIWIVYTLAECGETLGEPQPNGPVIAQSEKTPLPYNTAAIVDADGVLKGFYRKTHLYDAHGERESERTAKGSGLFHPIETPFGRIGLGICYDLRFPEVARAAACAGCDLMIYPSAWYDGDFKELHWETLIAARAIENEMFVAGVCRSESKCIGRSRIVNPQGATLAEAAARETTIVVADVDINLAREARRAMPVLDHRRPEIY